MKKSIFIVVITFCIVLFFYFCINLSTWYYEDYEPGSNYRVRINKISKKMIINSSHYCSYVGCKTTKTKCKIRLTNDEYHKIVVLWKNKKDLIPQLETLCENEKIMINNFEEAEDYYISKEEYKNMDVNNDGAVSSREFANYVLYDMIQENKK